MTSAIQELIREIKDLESTIKAMRSEIHYAIHSNKTDDVKRHYLDNAIRYADEALQGRQYEG